MAPYFERTAHDTSVTISDNFHPEIYGGRTHKPRHGHPTTLKLKVVCKPCNNGWMSGIEAAAKPSLEPMLAGKRILLDQRAQMNLATWAALKVMIFERFDTETAVFTRDQTLNFALNKSPPNHMNIWLLRSRDPFAAARINRGFASLFKTIPTSVREAETPNTEVVLFGVGQLLLYIEYSHLPAVKIEKVRQVASKRLWPFYRDPLQWPPMRTLSGQEAMHLGMSLQRFLARPGMRAL